MHGQTVQDKQERGINKGSWDRFVSNCNHLLLGSDHLGWSHCCHSQEIKWRRHHSGSDEHSLWSYVRKKQSQQLNPGLELKTCIPSDINLSPVCSFSDCRSLTYAAPDIQIFNSAKAAGNEVFQVIKRKPAISYDSEGKTLEKINGNIDMRDVYFTYPSRKERLILDGFSLSIPAGKVVALVGSSGCGKSTVISLVARFYDPSQGLQLGPRPLRF